MISPWDFVWLSTQKSLYKYCYLLSHLHKTLYESSLYKAMKMIHAEEKEKTIKSKNIFAPPVTSNKISKK